MEIISQNCIPDLLFLLIKCWPFYLPRELGLVFMTVVYIPPQVNTQRTLSELYRLITSHENAHPGRLFIVSTFTKHILGDCTQNTTRKDPRPLLQRTQGDISPSAVRKPWLVRLLCCCLFTNRSWSPRSRWQTHTVQHWTWEAEEKLQDCFDFVQTWAQECIPTKTVHLKYFHFWQPITQAQIELILFTL